MIHTTLLPALLAMGATEPVAVSTYAALEPSIALTPRADDGEDVFSYSYIEIGATTYDADDFDDEADTYNAELSFQILKIFNIFLG